LLGQPISEKYNEVYDKMKLHEDIETLIFTQKNSKNIDSIVEATTNIIEYMKSNKGKEIYEGTDLPNSMMTTILMDKYTEKYSSMSETEQNILSVLIDTNSNKKEIVYSNVIRECIDMINEKLVDSSLETKDKLLRVKDKLLNDSKDITEDFNNRISKLVSLRESLK
jgi:hypothetical protein